MVTVEPASATSTVPVIVCAAEVVVPPLLVIATAGAVFGVDPDPDPEVNPCVSTPSNCKSGFAM
jgi:hypothetical protein